ncbi:STN domain-containing protein, partial [Parabacteroides distasonis]|uniref:STN domain-containing protein n=1 Tax=Parabacteroides distasonis TaxID=823 RepID=UPI00325AAB67
MNRNKSICITILCLSLAMVRSLPIDAQKVTFHDGFISLKQAFEKLESVSTYKIAYNDSQLDVSRKVLMDQKEMEVLLALSQLLKNTGYTYKVGSINSIFYFLHKAAEPFNCLEQ